MIDAPSVCDCMHPPGWEVGAPGRPEHCSERGLPTVLRACSSTPRAQSVARLHCAQSVACLHCAQRPVHAACSERACLHCAQSVARSTPRALRAWLVSTPSAEHDCDFSNNTPFTVRSPARNAFQLRELLQGKLAGGAGHPSLPGTEVPPCCRPPCAPPPRPPAPCSAPRAQVSASSSSPTIWPCPQPSAASPAGGSVLVLMAQGRAP